MSNMISNRSFSNCTSNTNNVWLMNLYNESRKKSEKWKYSRMHIVLNNREYNDKIKSNMLQVGLFTCELGNIVYNQAILYYNIWHK